MFPALRAGLRVAATRPRVVGLVALTVAAETALRAGVATVHPVFALLVPPVAAVPFLGAGFPSVRAAAVGADGDVDRDRDRDVGSRLRERGLPLLALAAGGHAFGLAVGTGLFLVLDTTVRFARYAAGMGAVSPPVMLLSPLVGVAAGTTLAWGLCVPAVTAVAEGRTARVGAAAAIGAARERPMWAAAVAGAYAAAGLAVAGSATLGVGVALTVRSPGSLPVAAGGLGGLAALVAGFVLYPVHVAALDRFRPPPAVSVGRVAVAALLFAGLVVGATAVRATETRPLGGPDPLPGDPDAAYATALENTESASHRVTYVGDGREVVITRALDRPERAYRQRESINGYNLTVYGDAGAVYATANGESDGLTWRTYPFALGECRVAGWTAVAYPAYWRLAGPEYALTGSLALPAPGTGDWQVREGGNGTLTLVLTGGDAVFAALLGDPPAETTYEAARIEMRVDPERGVLTGGRARLAATTPARNLSRAVRFEVVTGEAVDVRRPAAVGPRTPGEWLWKLFAY